MALAPSSTPHLVSAVVPVYRVADQLGSLLHELRQLASSQTTPQGRSFVVSEIVVVYDGGSLDGAAKLKALTGAQQDTRVVWLSRNFGQHPATLAGMSASAGEWIVTLDEDGQFPPSEIGILLDHALNEQSPVVYGQPLEPTNHSLWRRMGSWTARSIFNLATDSREWSRFSSFRLILGEIGRSVGAYCTNETYLDVALTWVSPRSASVNVTYRHPPADSGYSFSRLFAHFMRMFLTMGTRPMRLFAILVYRRLVLGFPTGFASTLALLLVLTGLLLLGLAVLSEYVGLIVRSAIGRPLYVPVTDPTQSALTRDKSAISL
jgi:undecaprenyl-phosphate 4-deoxy-4-formamido-L-arabinose transferase